MKEQGNPSGEERKILLYLMGTSISYIALVGGFLVFILLLIDINKQILAVLFSAYLSLSLSILMTFQKEILKRFGIRKYIGSIGLFFLLISIALLINQMS